MRFNGKYTLCAAVVSRGYYTDTVAILTSEAACFSEDVNHSQSIHTT